MSSKKNLQAVAALIVKDGKYLLAQRKKGDCYQNLWEFPGGSIEPGESPSQAIEREINEELNLKVRAGSCLGQFFDQNRRLKLKIYLFSCSIIGGVCRAKDCQDFGFFTLTQANKLSLAPADKKILSYLSRL